MRVARLCVHGARCVPLIFFYCFFLLHLRRSAGLSSTEDGDAGDSPAVACVRVVAPAGLDARSPRGARTEQTRAAESTWDG
jgi:hypothetical protein